MTDPLSKLAEVSNLCKLANLCPKKDNNLSLIKHWHFRLYFPLREVVKDLRLSFGCMHYMLNVPLVKFLVKT